MKSDKRGLSALAAELGQGKIAPVYLFLGEEDFLIETALAETKRLLVTKGFEDFDYELCYGGELAFAEILKRLQSPPFGSKRRLVVLKKLKKLTPSEREALVAYLESPNPTTCLICVAAHESATDAFMKSIARRSHSITFALPEHRLPAEIEARARAKGLALEPGAAELIRELVGNSLYTIDSELEKLKILLGSESKVSRELIAEVSGNSREYLVWELTQQVGERRHKKALEILCRLKDWEEEPTWIVAALGREFFDLLSMKSVTQEPNSHYTPAFISGKKAYVASQVKARSRRWSRAEIVSRLRQLKTIDLQIKQGRNDPFHLLETFISQDI